jgi:hypothetical protein
MTITATLPVVRRVDPDLLRKGELLLVPAHARTYRQNMEMLEIEQRLAEKLDRKIEAERAANLAHDLATEARQYPTNPNIKDD